MNMHRMSVQRDLQQIGPYGAGCQIRSNHTDHETMMKMIKAHPAVAETAFKAHDGSVHYSYLFSYLLTLTTDWQGL